MQMLLLIISHSSIPHLQLCFSFSLPFSIQRVIHICVGARVYACFATMYYLFPNIIKYNIFRNVEIIVWFKTRNQRLILHRMLVILNTSFHFFLVPLSLSFPIITSSAFSLALCLPSPSPFPFPRSVSNPRSVSVLRGSVSSFSVLPFQLSILVYCTIPMGTFFVPPLLVVG